MKSFTDLFIRKPVLAFVVSLIILATGWRSIYSLPVRQYPRIESSSIVISTVYIGASAETVRGFLTTPIERAVSAIDGIDYIESTSTAGVSQITVHLRLNHSSNDALAEISARLNQVRSDLPQEAESPVIDIQRTDKPFATFYLSFTSPELSLTRLNDYLVREVQPELATIEGVQRVGVEGQRNLAMRIWLSPTRMDALNVTPTEVFDSLRKNNFLAAVGRTKSSEVQVDLITNTDLRTPQEFEQLIVREQQGSIVRLRDVARIDLDSEEPTGEAGYNRDPAIYLSVWPLPSSNELEVAQRLRAKMEEVRPKLPESVKMEMAFDGTYYMSHAITEITRTLLETIGIVAFVVFLFMGSVRTVLVPLVAMPVSLVGAALAMMLMGFSLNLLTILAVVLSVGLVVDDAIVMVENVERHIRDGRTKLDAALIGARELALPVISMTITLAAVYAPIGFQGGLTGVLFKEFAFTLAAAVVVSGVVALTLSPVMSKILVPAHGKESRFVRFVNGVFEKLRGAYAALLSVTIGLRWTMAAAAVMIALGAMPLYNNSKKELAPKEDEGIVFFVLLAAPDASLESTRAAAAQVSSALEAIPEQKVRWRVVMSPSKGFGGANMNEWDKRDRTTKEILGQAYGLVTPVAGVQAVPFLPNPLPGAGQYDVELVVTSSQEPEQMAQYAGQLVGAAFGSGMFLYADTDLKIDLPQARIIIDRQKVADVGLDLATVGRDLAVLLSGGYVNRFNYEGRSYKVIPQVEDIGRSDPTQLLQLKVRTKNGGTVQVGSLVRIEMQAAPRTLARFQQRNAFRINAVVRDGVTKAEALAALEKAAGDILPTQGYSLDYAGESRQLKQEGSSLVVTLGFAIGLIYLVLAAQFSSFRDPLIVLLGSVPLAITGALIFTFLGVKDATINIYSQVGLITLVGLVTKNGILIVEFANHLQEQGLSKVEAARQAAVTRFRPVLMTSVATVAGHAPLIFVHGAGAAARNNIGIVLVTGMMISTFFTLLFVPSIYVLLAGTHRKHEHHEPSRGPARSPANNGTAPAPALA
ncbi:MAG: efflux RND transporter permease subunit [Phycisphaerales bacterium]|nr:efflux RND transporter permease subunit [Phycisphaerales bacterium]